MGRKAYTHILVSDDADTVLIGVVTPEILGLEAGPVMEELGEAKTYLL
jgi:hypothetical protein